MKNQDDCHMRHEPGKKSCVEIYKAEFVWYTILVDNYLIIISHWLLNFNSQFLK